MLNKYSEKYVDVCDDCYWDILNGASDMLITRHRKEVGYHCGLCGDNKPRKNTSHLCNHCNKWFHPECYNKHEKDLTNTLPLRFGAK